MSPLEELPSSDQSAASAGALRSAANAEITPSPRGGVPEGDERYRLVCEAFAARRERRYVFDPKLFADPAWDIFLFMYCSHLAGEQLTVSNVVVATEVPFTTGLRWLKSMETAGLVNRLANPTDRRSEFVELTTAAIEKLETYLERLRKKNLMRLV